MEYTTKRVSDLRANPDNPRIIRDDKFKKLVKSLKDFPEMLSLRPIVINADNVVLGGNMRLKACIEAGIDEVPVLYARDLTPDQMREFIIKDNVGYGEWDWDILANQWDASALLDWGIDLPAFSVDALDELPTLPDGDKSGFEQMAFILTADQADIIREALSAAKSKGPFVDTGNDNSNGNALQRVAEFALNALR